MAAGIQYYGTGRRKTSTARVFLRPGNGGLVINRKPIEQAFPTEALRTQIKQPLLVTETADKFDVLATIAGRGIRESAQAEDGGDDGDDRRRGRPARQTRPEQATSPASV